MSRGGCPVVKLSSGSVAAAGHGFDFAFFVICYYHGSLGLLYLLLQGVVASFYDIFTAGFIEKTRIIFEKLCAYYNVTVAVNFFILGRNKQYAIFYTVENPVFHKIHRFELQAVVSIPVNGSFIKVQSFAF